MLEAMACGVPVAGYPVRGPIDIVKQGVTGCIDQDLKKAALQVLRLDPARCREAALNYSWEKSTQHFLKNLVDARANKQNMERAA
jgi:glycosyltransferase involved in cell wall biosynthesis